MLRLVCWICLMSKEFIRNPENPFSNLCIEPVVTVVSMLVEYCHPVNFVFMAAHASAGS
jgi:hypothetical protein